MQRRILVIEDNNDLAALLQLHLTDQSWTVDLEFKGDTGYKKAVSREYDLILLDIMLPVISNSR